MSEGIDWEREEQLNIDSYKIKQTVRVWWRTFDKRLIIMVLLMLGIFLLLLTAGYTKGRSDGVNICNDKCLIYKENVVFCEESCSSACVRWRGEDNNLTFPLFTT